MEGHDKSKRTEGATTSKNKVKAQVVAFQTITPSLFSKWVSACAVFCYLLTLLHSPSNSKGWWIPLDFSHIWCHLWVNIVLFLLLPSFHHLFHFLALLYWLGPTLKKVMISRRDLVPDLKKKIIQYSTIQYFSSRGFMKIKFIKFKKFLFLFCVLFFVTK